MLQLENTIPTNPNAVRADLNFFFSIGNYILSYQVVPFPFPPVEYGRDFRLAMPQPIRQQPIIAKAGHLVLAPKFSLTFHIVLKATCL